MTGEEFLVLERANLTTLSVYEKLSLEELTKTYKKVNPQSEYLRASDEPHNSDTLLRAAASTETTQQNQLLRPAQDANQ